MEIEKTETTENIQTQNSEFQDEIEEVISDVFKVEDDELSYSSKTNLDPVEEKLEESTAQGYRTMIYDAYIKKVDDLLNTLKRIDERTDDSVLKNHTAVIYECLNNILKLKENNNISDPIFLFKDGPVTRSIKNGSLLILEDFDLP
jgi:hypothetical protein